MSVMMNKRGFQTKEGRLSSWVLLVSYFSRAEAVDAVSIRNEFIRKVAGLIFIVDVGERALFPLIEGSD